jgi:hypothetical protein
LCSGPALPAGLHLTGDEPGCEVAAEPQLVWHASLIAASVKYQLAEPAVPASGRQDPLAPATSFAGVSGSEATATLA